MRIETERMKEREATAELIRQLVRDDTLRGEFMILSDETDDENFVQIACDYEDVGGKSDGCFDLEYQEGTGGRLFHCKRRVSADEVESVFLDELAGPHGNYVRDVPHHAASLNAEALALSKSDFEAAGENISWVLTRLKVRMSRFPKWEEKVSILTYPRGGRRIVAYRDFVLAGEGGAELGRATSEWMLIDLASRKVVAIPEAVFAAENTVREPVFGDEQFAKLRWDCRETASDALVFRARRGDIDMNGHVNNVHYVEWLMEGRPNSAGPCRELDMVFKSETLAGDEVRVESVETAPGDFIHRVYAPDGRDHVLAKTSRIAKSSV